MVLQGLVAMHANFALILFLASGLSFEDDQYDFVPNTERFVAIARGTSLFIGKLDSAGNFTQDCRWVGLKVGQKLGRLPAMELLTLRTLGSESVYEYRSGRLIKGELDKEGNFIP